MQDFYRKTCILTLYSDRLKLSITHIIMLKMKLLDTKVTLIKK